MSKKTITFVWRDENYGRVHAKYAFRCSVEPFPSATADTKLARLFRKAGFAVNHNRAAWICEDGPDNAGLHLIELVKGAGFEVKHWGWNDEVPTFLKPKGAEPDTTTEDAPSLKM